MKSSVIALLLALAAVTAGAQSALTPLQYNNRITAITDSLYARGQVWTGNFRVALQVKDYSILKGPREDMLRLVDSGMSIVKGLKDVGNSQSLHAAMVAYLEYERSLIADGFVLMESLPATATDEEVQARVTQIKTMAATEPAEFKKLYDAQTAYAKENGFTIEE